MQKLSEMILQEQVWDRKEERERTEKKERGRRRGKPEKKRSEEMSGNHKVCHG